MTIPDYWVSASNDHLGTKGTFCFASRFKRKPGASHLNHRNWIAGTSITGRQEGEENVRRKKASLWF